MSLGLVASIQHYFFNKYAYICSDIWDDKTERVLRQSSKKQVIICFFSEVFLNASVM